MIEFRYNYQKLLGKMKERGVTQDVLADKIGISAASMNKKLKNRSQFKQGEMIGILSFLGCELKEIPSYFFAH